jgi:hypothetical protein
MQLPGRENGGFYPAHTHVLYLHQLPYSWISCSVLSHSRVLAECKALHGREKNECMGSLAKFFFITALFISGFGCGTTTCDCFDDPETAVRIKIFFKSFDATLSEEKAMNEYFQLVVFRNSNDSFLSSLQYDKSDTILSAAVWGMNEIQKFRIQSDSFGIYQEYTDLKVAGTRDGRIGCKCFTATEKSGLISGNRVDLMEDIVIRK